MIEGKHLQILAYGPFSDIPRGLVTLINERMVSLESAFNTDGDDYEKYYNVSIMVGATLYDMYSGVFAHKHYDYIPIGSIAVAKIVFDPSKRKSFQSLDLEKMVTDCGFDMNLT